MIGQVLVLAGSLLTLVAAIGMVRFDDVFARMHALAKASTAGVILVLVGAAVTAGSANDITSLVIAGVLQLLTGPVASNMVARATYRAEGIPRQIDAVELTDDRTFTE